MISVCTVTLEPCEAYGEIYEKSITTRTKLVDEVLIARPDWEKSREERWDRNGISFTRFGTLEGERQGQGLEHGLGLHACMDRAKNEHLMFLDPDVFFYTPVDEFFYNVKQKYELDVVGISYAAATNRSYSFFPCIICMLVNRKSLPGEDWLKGQIKGGGKEYPGKFLIRMDDAIGRELYPNPDVDFDTASSLWLWSHQNNWKWLAFQTADVHNYTTKFYRGNVKLTEKLPIRKLLYHTTSSTCPSNWQRQFDEWQEAWVLSEDE